MATPFLRDHLRKFGVSSVSQKAQLTDSMVLVPMGQDPGNPKSPYYPLGAEKMSPVEYTARVADYLMDKTDTQARLINNSLSPAMSVSAKNIKPTLIHPAEMARRGLRVNVTHLPDSPLASRGQAQVNIAAKAPRPHPRMKPQ